MNRGNASVFILHQSAERLDLQRLHLHEDTPDKVQKQLSKVRPERPLVHLSLQ